MTLFGESPPPLCAGIATFLSWWFEQLRLTDQDQQILEDYYASFRRSFGPRMRRLYNEQVREVEGILKKRPGLRLLEIGCGLGTESLWFALKGARVTGLDVRKDRITVARVRQKVVEEMLDQSLACTFEIASVLDYLAEPFDVVWLEQAFHHLEPRADVVPKLASLVVPGGYLVISEANALNPFLQLELLVRRGLPRVTKYSSPDGQIRYYGVERITTASAIRRAFSDKGVAFRSLRRFRVFPNRPVFERLSGLEAALERNWLSPLLTHYNYIGSKLS